MYFALAQTAFVLWAIVFAHFQVPCIKAMRDFVPLNNAYARPLHKRGLLLSCFIALATALALFACTGKAGQCFLLIPTFIAIYKICFDGIIGLEAYGSFFYIGNTARQDIWLNKHFPQGTVGKTKLFFCIATITLTNLISYLLL